MRPYGNRNKIERWFREMKERTKRFYNNANSKTLKSIEELVTAIAIMHNIIRAGGEEVIPTWRYHQGSIEVYGNLKIMVTSFNKPSRIAFQKGNTIYVSIEARGYPDSVLKYIIAHELAHLAVKRHTWRFWKILGIIYPEYEKGKEELMRGAKVRFR
jgi:hypothetical protein